MMSAVRQRTLRPTSGFNPYLAAISAARRNPRAAAVLLAGAGVAAATMLLIAVSAAQAFVVISQQSTNNTQGRFSLAVNQTEGPADDDAVAGAAGSDLFDSPAGGVVGATNATASGYPTGVVGPEEVVSVRGIRVHHSIADNVEQLLAAAEADGITLSGWGWRDNKTQIRLRRQHCGTSEYAIYRMPSSRCSPPTARPGRSQHEWGLAIDFTYNGGSISSHRSPGFKWLNANAATYGLKNLASEPWHWSTTGR
jgi:hypothetical protein